MKDHEIIAILEGCDDEQRERVLAWAKARWAEESRPVQQAPHDPADRREHPLTYLRPDHVEPMPYNPWWERCRDVWEMEWNTPGTSLWVDGATRIRS